MSFLYLLLEPHQTTYHLNSDVLIRIRVVYVTCLYAFKLRLQIGCLFLYENNLRSKLDRKNFKLIQITTMLKKNCCVFLLW